MFRLRRAHLIYRKCYLLLSALTICLIIYFSLISHKQNLMLLTFSNNVNNIVVNSNNNKNYNNDYHNNNNNRSNINISRNNSFQNLTKKQKQQLKHVFDSNKLIRDWHNYTYTSRSFDTSSIPQPQQQQKQLRSAQVTRDHPQSSTSSRTKQHHKHLKQKEQQQNVYGSKLRRTQPRLHHRHSQNLILFDTKFGQMFNTTETTTNTTSNSNITYNLKLIEKKKFKNTSNKNIYNFKNLYNNNKSSQLTGFNVELSESLPLQRLVPDTRHKRCKTQRYPQQLRECSIIIVYHNELTTILLRSLYSIVNRTPEELLKEIILVDDYSDSNIELEKQLKDLFPDLVKLIHLPQREGLIRARLKGAKIAKGEILVFLDAHIEVNENWLPPLLAPIGEDEKTCTTPIIDIIKYDTLEYQGTRPVRGGFNWQFNYVQLPLLKKEKEDLPHNNPVMNGGLFAISRDYFWLLGGYDEGLEIWGAEQFELSFKIWMCAGRILEVPCSRVGHLYRDPEFRVNYTNRKDDYISRNYKRVAEVWMDEYKEYLYEHVPKLNLIEAGDLRQQKLLRQQLKCKSFKWFLSNIAPDLLKAYPPVKPTDFALGAIQSLALPKLCLDLDSTERRQILENVLRPCSPDLKYPYTTQKFHLSFRHDLRHHENCLEVQTWSNRAPIWLWPCHHLEGNQYWFYDRNTKMFIHGKTDYQQRCLDLDRASRKVFVSYCDFARPEQKWQIGYVNQTAMDRYFEE